MLLVDSHCHLDRLSYGSKQTDMADVLAKAAKLDVGYFLCVSVTQAQFPTMMAAIAPYPQVFASCGVHPLNQEPISCCARLPIPVSLPSVKPGSIIFIRRKTRRCSKLRSVNISG